MARYIDTSKRIKKNTCLRVSMVRKQLWIHEHRLKSGTKANLEMVKILSLAPKRLSIV